jgi:hypothetical protein
MDEDTAEILNTNTTNNNDDNNNNRFSLRLLYPFLESFKGKAINSVTAGHCDDRSVANFGSVIFILHKFE